MTINIDQIMELIAPNDTITIVHLDDEFSPKTFEDIDSLVLSKDYDKLKRLEVYSIKRTDTGIQLDVAPCYTIKIELNISDAIIIKNIIEDFLKNTPKNSVNNELYHRVELFYEKLKQGLWDAPGYYVEDDEENEE